MQYSDDQLIKIGVNLQSSFDYDGEDAVPLSPEIIAAIEEFISSHGANEILMAHPNEAATSFLVDAGLTDTDIVSNASVSADTLDVAIVLEIGSLVGALWLIAQTQIEVKGKYVEGRLEVEVNLRKGKQSTKALIELLKTIPQLVKSSVTN